MVAEMTAYGACIVWTQGVFTIGAPLPYWGA
jgi:hypothetical protein